MTRLHSVIAIVVILVAGAGPAFANTSIQEGKRLCRNAVSSSQPKPESVRIDDDQTRANSDVLIFSIRIRSADGTRSEVSCRVDRRTDAVTLQGDGADLPAGDVAVSGDSVDLLPAAAVDTLSADELHARAEQGDAEAQLTLGQMYSIGQGVERNDEQALQWFRLAADQGSVEAQFRLGSIYEEGIGVLADDLEAAKWYRLAFDQGNYEAMLKLEALSARIAAAAAENQQVDAAAPLAQAPSTPPAATAANASQTPPQSDPPADIKNVLMPLFLIFGAPPLLWWYFKETFLTPVKKCPTCKTKMRVTSSRREHTSTFQQHIPGLVKTIEAGRDYWNFACDSCGKTATSSRPYKQVIDRHVLR